MVNSRRTALTIALVMAMAMAGLAHADAGMSVDAVGEASGRGDEGRARAIDDAFAAAVDQVIAIELTRTQVRRNRELLRAKITRRARLFVLTYRVRDQSASETTVRVEITAKIDRQRLREALADLDLGAVSAAPRRLRPKIVLLLRAVVAGVASASFGKEGGDGGVVGRVIAHELSELGFDLVAASGNAAPVSRSTRGRLPLDDEAAIAVARRVGAGAAVVVGVEVGEDGSVRATRMQGATAKAQVRIITVAGDEVAAAKVDGAGYGRDSAGATSAAARAAATRTVAAIASSATAYWPAPRQLTDAQVVIVTGARTWVPVAAIIARLRSARGVTEVKTRHLGRGEVIIAVATTMTDARLADLVRSTSVADHAISARVKPGVVEVSVEDQVPSPGDS